MIEYTRRPDVIVSDGDVRVSVFQEVGEENLDPRTVESFGEEWQKFSAFESKEIEKVAHEYFDVVDLSTWVGHRVLDVGCGSGRWSRFLSAHVKFVEAIDPSRAVFSAARQHSDLTNVRFTCVSIDGIPFPDESFDAVVSLGVLHHIPDTYAALETVVKKLRPGGMLVLYLYYDLDDAGWVSRTLFLLVDRVRRVVSALPGFIKRPLCDLIAIAVYLPMVLVGRVVTAIAPEAGSRFPLAYYHNKSLRIMRNDALDRFGTPLEQRFSKQRIHEMVKDAGLDEIRFSDRAPFWHCSAVKPHSES
jgi:SAM-dependent methyltransferase